MLTGHRGIATLLVLLALAGAGVASGWWLIARPIDPASAPLSQVLRALVLSDLAAESPERQLAYVERLQGELARGLEPAGGMPQLSATYQQRLARNIAALQYRWFSVRTAEYAALATHERTPFLDRELALVGAWSQIAALQSATPPTAEESTAQLIGLIDEWTTIAQGETRQQMVVAVQDATVCWLATSDLSEQPHAVRCMLARRFAAELKRGATAEIGALVTDAERSTRLKKNAELLVAAYVCELAADYHDFKPAERVAFLDQRLDEVEKWRVLELLGSPAGGPQNGVLAQLGALAQLNARAEQWIAQAPPQERGEVERFVRALQQRVLWRQMPAWMRGK